MNKPYLRRIAGVIATIGAVAIAPVVHGDDLTTVLQYEIEFGKKRTSTFYLSYQPARADRPTCSCRDADRPMRMALYSTDPGTRTMFGQLSRSSGEPGDMSAGETLMGIVGVVVVVGAPVYAITKMASSTAKIGDNVRFPVPPAPQEFTQSPPANPVH